MNSSIPPPSTRFFFVSRIRGRSATVRALSSTIARASARSASNMVSPCRSATMPSASARESSTRTDGVSRGRRRTTRVSRSRSSSAPGSANSKRTAMSASSGFSGIAGPTMTIVRADPANSWAVSRRSRRVAGASRCAIGSLRRNVPSPLVLRIARRATARSTVPSASCGWAGQRPLAALQVQRGMVRPLETSRTRDSKRCSSTVSHTTRGWRDRRSRARSRADTSKLR